MDLRDIERMVYPPIVLGRGYFILDLKPGGSNHWRPLGDTSRPLAKLVEAEAR